MSALAASPKSTTCLLKVTTHLSRKATTSLRSTNRSQLQCFTLLYFHHPDLSWIRSKLTFSVQKSWRVKFSQAAIRHHRATIFHDGHKETVLEMMRMVASKFPRHLEVGGGCSKLWEELLPHIIDCDPSDHHHHHQYHDQRIKLAIFPFSLIDYILSRYLVLWSDCHWIWCCRSWWW